MLTVLYRDERLVVIDKPSGWLVHRSNLDRHETCILVQALLDQNRTPADGINCGDT
jgi:tRNA pseudouridine65 synthase